MTTFVDDAIGRLTVRAPADADHHVRTVTAQLADMDLAAPTIPDRAILLVRRITATARPHGRKDVEAQIQAATADAWRIASRPWLGAPPDAPAVRFADGAELLACYARDVALAAEDRWWWLHVAPPLARDVATILAADPRQLPAVLARLEHVGAATVVVDRLTPVEAAELASNVATTFGAAFTDARRAAEAPPQRVTTTTGSRGEPAAASPDPRAWLLRLCRVATRTPHRVPAVVAAVAATSAPSASPRPGMGSRTPGATGDRARASGRPAITATSPASARDPGAPARSSPTDPAAIDASPADPELPDASPAGPSTSRRSRAGPSPPDPSTAGPAITDRDSPATADPAAATEHDRSGTAAVAATSREPATAAHPARGDRPEVLDAPAEGPTGFSDHPGGVRSELAGIFHLVGVLADLDVDVERSWRGVAEGARWLLSDMTPTERDDPVWAILASLGTGDDPADDPDAGGEAAGELAARVGPAMAAHLKDRLGPWTDLPVHALLRRPGVITPTSSHVDISFAIDDTWLPARLAGLDSDPGWVPWLGRVVLFHYR